MKTRRLILAGCLFLFGAGCKAAPATPPPTTSIPTPAVGSATTTDAEWRAKLTPSQYYILRQAGTEVPFSSPLDYETRPGTYYAADCDEPVFRSEQKYDSGTGWPSFWAPIKPDAVVLKEDDSIPFEPRTEVLSKCGGHLGHVFDDGPQPTGKRYCMNGAALIFVPDVPITLKADEKYFGNEVRADLDGNGTQDVAFLITQDGGGSGTFFYLIAALRNGDTYVATNSVLLGDRIAPQTTEFRDGVLIVNYADRAPGQPMTTAPSVGVSKRFKITNGQLAEILK